MKLVFSLIFIFLFSCSNLQKEAKVSSVQNLPSIDEAKTEAMLNWSVQVEQGFKIAKMQLNQNPKGLVFGDARDFLKANSDFALFENMDVETIGETWNFSLVQNSLAFWDAFQKAGARGVFYCDQAIFCKALEKRLDEIGIGPRKIKFYNVNDARLLSILLNWKRDSLFLSSSFSEFERKIGGKLLFKFGAKRVLMGLKANMVRIPRISQFSQNSQFSSL